jgi:hypothetical protein
VRRSVDDALLALREQIKAWASGKTEPDVRVFVYPPEWEALMLARLPQFAEDRAAEGTPIEIVDAAQAFRTVVDDRSVEGQLTALEQRAQNRLLDNLRVLGNEAIEGVLRTPLADGLVCRLLVNTGALATFVSYSAITNELHGSSEGPMVPTAIAFPGEADERSLNLLGLRPDTNYRVPRI